ncbi:MAG: carboxypeptidase-like regulatory domain-containing protein [Gammaproteobacteria bacterium]|nr:carboxypeptidase-like regulatory domain-containing protein [Gammaproteobacteria bacterium]
MKHFKSLAPLVAVFLACTVCGEETTTITGRIVDSDTDSKVWIGLFSSPLQRGAEAKNWTSVQSEDFTLDVPKNEDVILVALRKNFTPITEEVSADSQSSEIQLEFGQGSTLRGTVFSTDDIEVPDATLKINPVETLQISLPEEMQFEWTSSSDGTFEISGLIPGSYEVQVATLYTRPALFSVRVSEEESSPRTFALNDAYFVRGHVQDYDGEEVSGAEVSAYMHVAFLGEFPRETVRSGSAGEFQVGPFIKGQQMSLSAMEPIRGSTYSNEVFSGNLEVTLVLSKMVTVQGVVLDSSTGLPIEAFLLKVWGQGWVRNHQIFSSEGIISVEVDSEAWAIVIDAPNYDVHFDTPIELVSLEVYDKGTIELDPGKRLTGTVTDAIDGEPVEGAQIWRGIIQEHQYPTGRETFIFRYLFERVSTTTSAQGEFSLEPMPSGESVIHVRAPDYTSQEIQLDALTTHLDIALKTWESVKSLLVGKVQTVTGDSIPASLDIFHVENNSGFGTRTNEDGTFEEDMYPGTVTVQARSDLGKSERVTVSLEEGATKEILLVIDPTGRISGTITGLQGAEGAFLSVLSGIQTVRNSGRLENGEFQISGVGLGSFSLRARTTMNRQLVIPFELSEDADDVRLDVSFQGNSRLYGLVKWINESASDFKVRVIGKEKGSMVGWSDILDDGTYEIQGLNDGEYWIEIAADEYEYDTVDGSSGNRLMDVVVNGDTEFSFGMDSF